MPDENIFLDENEFAQKNNKKYTLFVSICIIKGEGFVHEFSKTNTEVRRKHARLQTKGERTERAFRYSNISPNSDPTCNELFVFLSLEFIEFIDYIKYVIWLEKRT